MGNHETGRGYAMDSFGNIFFGHGGHEIEGDGRDAEGITFIVK